MIYLASPYTAKLPNGELDHATMEARFDAVCRYAGELMKLGHVVYSPIAHNHPIATRVGLPRGWDYWERFDREMLKRASMLVILKLDGWDRSPGVTAEYEMAMDLGLDFLKVDPSEMVPLAGSYDVGAL